MELITIDSNRYQLIDWYWKSMTYRWWSFLWYMIDWLSFFRTNFIDNRWQSIRLKNNFVWLSIGRCQSISIDKSYWLASFDRLDFLWSIAIDLTCQAYEYLHINNVLINLKLTHPPFPGQPPRHLMMPVSWFWMRLSYYCTQLCLTHTTCVTCTRRKSCVSSPYACSKLWAATST